MSKQELTHDGAKHVLDAVQEALPDGASLEELAKINAIICTSAGMTMQDLQLYLTTFLWAFRIQEKQVAGFQALQEAEEETPPHVH